MELHCSRDLALRLGAVDPANAADHRDLKGRGYLLVRDLSEPSRPMFWPWVGGTGMVVVIGARRTN